MIPHLLRILVLLTRQHLLLLILFYEEVETDNEPEHVGLFDRALD